LIERAGRDCRVTLRLRVFIAVAAGIGFAPGAPAAEFLGWQGLRVVPQEGNPDRMIAADLDGDGPQELIVVNTRHSRLDLYRRQSPDEQKPPYAGDPDRPNELPLAPDWAHTELPLEDLPADVAAADLDGDGRHELLVLTGPSLKLSAYGKQAGKWDRLRQWDLPAGNVVGRGPLLLIRTTPESTTDTTPTKTPAGGQSKTPASTRPAATKTPAAEKPAAEKPAAEKPAAVKPAAVKPAAVRPDSRSEARLRESAETRGARQLRQGDPRRTAGGREPGQLAPPP
jgi:hypothetical protein